MGGTSARRIPATRSSPRRSRRPASTGSGPGRRCGSSRSIGRPRLGRVLVHTLGPVLRLHLDDRPDQRHYPSRQVLPPSDRRDLTARRLARDQDPRPCMARRPDLNRRHRNDARPRCLVLLRHVRSLRRPTNRLGIDRAHFECAAVRAPAPPTAAQEWQQRTSGSPCHPLNV